VPTQSSRSHQFELSFRRVIAGTNTKKGCSSSNFARPAKTDKILISIHHFRSMPVPVRRLIAYYRSPAFAEDHAYLDRYDPLAAEQQRHSIIDHLNENLATEGIIPTRTELAVQARFIAGEMPLAQMLEQVELYVASIELRWPLKRS